MKGTRAFLLLLGTLVVLFAWRPQPALACGHDGVFMGVGYTQLFMYTPEHSLGAPTSGRVYFSPGYGANATVGYDFCGSRWGIQMPFEFVRLKLNHAEWVNQFGSSVEAILHLVESDSGWDFHLLGGVGWSRISEGAINDRSNAYGITASLGPGVSYFFARGERVSAALALEVPFRMIYYFGDRLSANGTTIIAFPIRLSIQVGF